MSFIPLISKSFFVPISEVVGLLDSLVVIGPLSPVISFWNTRCTDLWMFVQTLVNPAGTTLLCANADEFNGKAVGGHV